MATDPDEFAVVSMGKPDIDKLDDALREPIKTGTYSNILSSNVRMLMQGVVPALLNELVAADVLVDADDQRVRRTAFGNSPLIMRYVVLKYKKLNGLAGLSMNNAHDVLSRSFQYLWQYSMRSANLQLPEPFGNADEPEGDKSSEMDLWKEEQFDSVLRLGLATRNATETSKALCFLACFGFTLRYVPRAGRLFETLLELHAYRLGLATGYDMIEHTLTRDLPPPWNQGNSEEPPHLDVGRLTSLVEHLKKDKSGVLLKQRIASRAQGADIFLLLRTGAKIHLFAVQAKNSLHPSKANSLRALGVLADGSVVGKAELETAQRVVEVLKAIDDAFKVKLRGEEKDDWETEMIQLIQDIEERIEKLKGADDLLSKLKTTLQPVRRNEVLPEKAVEDYEKDLKDMTTALKSYRSVCYSGAALEALQSVLEGVEGVDEVVIHRVVAVPLDAATLMQNWGLDDLGTLNVEFWTKEFLQPTMYAMIDDADLEAEARESEDQDGVQAQDVGNEEGSKEGSKEGSEEGSKETFSVWDAKD
uniref:Uncharacterized protein n=1 Tax=Cyclophora tenuis TaxID=216820 RepID=A0A7S1DDU4_CYCTE